MMGVGTWGFRRRGEEVLNDITCIAAMLGASTLVLVGGVVHGIRTRLDRFSLGALSGFTLLSAMMTAGAVGQI